MAASSRRGNSNGGRGRKAIGGGRRKVISGKIPLMEGKELERMSWAYAEVVEQPEVFKKALEKDGVAIISGVVSEEECKRLEAAWEEGLQALLGRARAEGEVPGSKSTGFTPLYGIPHGEFCWEARLQASIRRVFAIVHETEDLVTGADLPFYLPPAYVAPAEGPIMPHADQNVHVKGMGSMDSWQSILYVRSCESSEAAHTVVFPGSHTGSWKQLMGDPLSKRLARKQDHFVRVAQMENANDQAQIMRDYRRGARRAPIPRGGLLLWSSRVLHQGYNPGRRLAMPVCWEPRSRRPLDAQIRKAEYCLRGFPTTHWACAGELHHMCYRLKKDTSANGASSSAAVPKKLTSSSSSLSSSSSSSSSSSNNHFKGTWLRSYAVKDDVHLDDTAELTALIAKAQQEVKQQSFGPNCEKLFSYLKPQIAEVI